MSATTSQGSFTNSNGVLTFSLGSLSTNATATASVRVAASAAGTVVNSASVTGAESDLSTFNNSAMVTTTVRTPLRASLTDVVVTNAQLQFTLVGEPGLAYVIQGSTNFTTWTSLATNTAAVPSGTIKFVDTSAPSFSHRFYRALRLIP